jgi:hypothetical protein
MTDVTDGRPLALGVVSVKILNRGWRIGTHTCHLSNLGRENGSRPARKLVNYHENRGKGYSYLPN